MALMRFSRLSLFFDAIFDAITAKNSGGTAGVFAVFCPPDPTEPRISAEHDASLADNSWEEQRKQRNRGVESSQSAPKTLFRGAVSRAGQNAARGRARRRLREAISRAGRPRKRVSRACLGERRGQTAGTGGPSTPRLRASAETGERWPSYSRTCATLSNPDFITVIRKCSRPFAESWCRPCKENRRAGLLHDFSVGEMRYDRNSYPRFIGDGMSKLQCMLQLGRHYDRLARAAIAQARPHKGNFALVTHWGSLN